MYLPCIEFFVLELLLHMLKPAISTITEKKLIGLQLTTSFANNRTAELWKKFMPARKQIKNSVSNDLYSVEIYPSADFFASFTPERNFQQWAAVEVTDFETIPDGMEKLLLPAGDYAMFIYRGAAKNASSFYKEIFGEWLPASGYRLDPRPHFALMGAAYKNDSEDSEETIWIPIGSTRNVHQG